MSTIKHIHTINASKTATWAALHDFGGVHRWHFNVATSPIQSENTTGLGAKRTCTFYDGSQMTEEVVAHKDEELMVVAFVEHAMPLSQANVMFNVRELGPETTEVCIEMDYAMMVTPDGWAMDHGMLEGMMTGVFSKMLEGLDTHLRTGALIGEGGVAVEA